MASSPNVFAPATSMQDSLASSNPTLQIACNPTRLRTANVANIANPRIAHWVDFDLHSLREAYRDLLAYPVPKVASSRSPLKVKGVNDLKTIFVDHVFPRLMQPIKIGATALEERLGRSLPDVSMCKDTPVELPYRSGLSLTSSDDNTHYLVSCVLMETQWTSAEVKSARDSGDDKYLPLRRVAAYCVSTDTRYGFVLTPGEVVVVRVSGTAHDTTQPCLIEWKAVPWGASGPDTLTVTLSLWFIAMMSLNPAHRALRPPGAVPPVNLWWKYRDPAGTVTYQHHLSLRQVVRPPTGVIIQDAPSA